MILVAVGANLISPDGQYPYQLCDNAVEALRGLAGLRVGMVSRWYRSAPVPPSAQPDYVNGVVRMEATGSHEPDPATFLALLQAIEDAAGRRRSVPNAARTLDLDIIAMGPRGGLRRDGPDPVLPHPRAHLRAFVLLPLGDVAPDWVHPGRLETAGEMIRLLPSADLLPVSISPL